MSLGAFLAILVLLTLLGGWLVLTNAEMTVFSLGGGLSWKVPVWALVLSGFAGGAALTVLLQVGILTRPAPEAHQASEALAELRERLDAVEAQLQSLADELVRSRPQGGEAEPPSSPP